jgi:hypothetical protein
MVKTECMGLGENGHALLSTILKHQKADSDPYQLVNKGGGDGRSKEVVSQLEDILITVSNLEFIAEIEEESTRLC